jgi:molybdopterin-guanine dinucleotide biosynthesis protein B
VHHDVDLDQPRKDSRRHRDAGAQEVILAGANRLALMVEHRDAEPSLADVLSRLRPVDLILIEGYKRDNHAKIEVWRVEAGHDLIQPNDPTIRAIATDAPLDRQTVAVLDLNDTNAIADFILHEVGLAV